MDFCDGIPVCGGLRVDLVEDTAFPAEETSASPAGASVGASCVTRVWANSFELPDLVVRLCVFANMRAAGS